MGKKWQILFSWAPKSLWVVDCSHEIKRQLLLGRKPMTNPDNVLKNRDITWPTKVCIVKSMVFPVVMYGCESRKQLDMTEQLNWTDTLSHYLTSNVTGNTTDNKNRTEGGKNTNQSFNTGFYMPHNLLSLVFNYQSCLSPSIHKQRQQDKVHPIRHRQSSFLP